MLRKDQYPVCEMDTDRDAIIQPRKFMAETLPEKCVITFFRRELDRLVEERDLPVIGTLKSEVVDFPIYEYTCGDERLCITMTFCGGPGAAATLEELYAMGCKKFLICGGAGALTKNSKVGEIVLPVSAVRDEGTSYHYLEPSREVECHQKTVQAVAACLEEMGIPFRAGKTWTTDAIYRETPDMVAYRRDEGCITVEMEAAAFFAVSQYYDIPLAQLLYAGDDVSGTQWDSRNWNKREGIRYNLLSATIEIIKNL